MTYLDAIALVDMEYAFAEKAHPHWPDDLIHQVAIMIEEAGESMQAALDYYDGKEGPEHLKQELAQTAAMCIRCIKGLDEAKVL